MRLGFGILKQSYQTFSTSAKWFAFSFEEIQIPFRVNSFVFSSFIREISHTPQLSIVGDSSGMRLEKPGFFRYVQKVES